VVIDDSELKLAAQGAKSAWRSSRNLIEYNDLLGEAHLWLVENYNKVEEWREEGRHGKNKIRNACRQKCLSVVARERRKRSNLQPGDVFYYTPQMIREVLPNVWDPDDWQTSQQVMTSESRTPSRPSEGNNRLAMIVDIRGALFNLPETDQQLLADMYKDGGLPLDVVATQWEVTERTVRRREERVLDKMVERLGGEPPWKR
jgi:DNA-directed RNA polymerase specialized sigma24 family protein